ncbi:tRNA pseudouridine synthase A [Spiroplasma chinense]|uniref:tRNA pseudouridine synthase A n=1 Tax=Spiroplasma chinense TaxID=216932 RepID=A0A5B9Y658_9MOLU|nr:tRNA pseudouridine(38-40) synthase TruA [Spiroplasma chinense]QEH62293.1 tRNA pseudouridine synthase A [Spiroplasma chinense]
MNYYLFTIEYDGTDFCGWAKQKGQSTIQGEIESALSRVARNSTFRVVGASKTDSGVHANDQKAWVELDFKPNLPGFLKALNNALPLGINIKNAKEIEQSYRVRNCIQKTYHYNLNFGDDDVFKNRYWFKPKYHIDLDKLTDCLELFVGYHDFKNFSGLKGEEFNIIESKRIVDEIKIVTIGELVKIVFKAKGFIRYQIRMMMGAALAYATGKTDLNTVKDVLNCKREKLPFMAEAKGLTLYNIQY